MPPNLVIGNMSEMSCVLAIGNVPETSCVLATGNVPEILSYTVPGNVKEGHCYCIIMRAIYTLNYLSNAYLSY